MRQSGLNNQEVKIAVWAGRAAGMRTEHDHTRARRRGCEQPSRGLVDGV
jgi:hypothetical protein